MLAVDGTKTRLTDRYTRDPSWSPDGKKIAFIQYTADNGVGTLMTMNRDGTDQQPVLVRGDPVPATVTVTWAPNARIAAVAGLDCGGGIRQWGIYVLDGRGGCFAVADDLGQGNPDVALIKHLCGRPAASWPSSIGRSKSRVLTTARASTSPTRRAP